MSCGFATKSLSYVVPSFWAVCDVVGKDKDSHPTNFSCSVPSLGAKRFGWGDRSLLDTSFMPTLSARCAQRESIAVVTDIVHICDELTSILLANGKQK